MIRRIVISAIKQLILVGALASIACLGHAKTAATDLEPLPGWYKTVVLESSVYDADITVDSKVDYVMATANSRIGGNGNIYTIKLGASNGALGWIATYDSGSFDRAHAMATDNNGNVYIAGATQIGKAFAGRLIKYNADGSLGWTFTWSGGEHEIMHGVATYKPKSQPLMIFTAAEGHSGSSRYARISRYDTTGNLLWTVKDDRGGPYYVRGLTTDGTNVYMTGLLLQNGIWKMMTVSYTVGSTFNWATPFSGGLHDAGADIAVDGGDLLVTGTSSNGSNYDIRIIKYPLGGGTPVWNVVFDGGIGEDELGYGISAGTYIAGRKWESGVSYFLLAKYNQTDGVFKWSTTNAYTGMGGHPEDGLCAVVGGDPGEMYVIGYTQAANGNTMHIVKYVQPE